MATRDMTPEEWHLKNVAVDTKVRIKNFGNRNGRLKLGPALAVIIEYAEAWEKRLEELEAIEQE